MKCEFTFKSGDNLEQFEGCGWRNAERPRDGQTDAGTDDLRFGRRQGQQKANGFKCNARETLLFFLESLIISDMHEKYFLKQKPLVRGLFEAAQVRELFETAQVRELFETA